jgi:hypothetical protein
MTFSLSKAVLAVEGVILFGLSGLWVFGFFTDIPRYARSDFGVLAILIGFAIIFFLAVAFWVMLEFFELGAEGLRKLSKKWWVFTAVGFAFSLGMAMLSRSKSVESRAVKEVINYAGFGLFFLAPMIHMALEMLWRPRYKHVA